VSSSAQYNLKKGSNSIKIFEDYKDVMSVNDVCKALGIGKNTAYKLLRENTIKSIVLAGKYKIPKTYLIEFVEKLSCNICA